MYKLSEVAGRAPNWYKQNMLDGISVTDKPISEATVEELLEAADHAVRSNDQIHLNDKLRLSTVLSEALLCLKAIKSE